jgi:hypothetical protein
MTKTTKKTAPKAAPVATITAAYEALTPAQKTQAARALAALTPDGELPPATGPRLITTDEALTTRTVADRLTRAEEMIHLLQAALVGAEHSDGIDVELAAHDGYATRVACKVLADVSEELHWIGLALGQANHHTLLAPTDDQREAAAVTR